MENTGMEQTRSGGRGCLMVLGVLNIIFGFVAIGSPLMAGTAATMIIGAMLLISGIFELVHAFSTGGWKSGVVAFLGGALAILGGGLILSRPLYGMAMLALILAVYFVVDGVVRIAWGFRARPLPGWGFVLFGGVASLFLGLMIWRGWPLSGMWAVGVLVGVRILLSGWTMLFLGMTIGQIETGLRENAEQA